jgi:hypothetical protein
VVSHRDVETSAKMESKRHTMWIEVYGTEEGNSKVEMTAVTIAVRRMVSKGWKEGTLEVLEVLKEMMHIEG